MYDVAIIGAGVIGASIFRELTKYDLKVALIEKENDVAMGTTKANSAIVHAGYDPKVGTLMAKYNVKGNEMFEELEQLRAWLDYRNEIIHGLLNKNIESLYSELDTKVEEGMKIARYFDSQCKLLKKNNKIRKYLKLQNN